MAQAPLKKMASASTASKRQSTNKTPRHRTIAPKSASLIRQKKITKKATAGLTARTEKKLAERVGHLELLADAGRDKGGVGSGKKDGSGGRKKGGK